MRVRPAQAASGTKLTSLQATYLDLLQQPGKKDLKSFLKVLVDNMGGVIVNRTQLDHFAAVYSDAVPARPFEEMLQELLKVGNSASGWLKLSPPEKGPVLWNMIRPNPWNCNLFPEWDQRLITCRLHAGEEGLNPQTLSCGNLCNDEQANAFRTLQQIGALPCCRTPPFCAAPVCSKLSREPAVCTNRPPWENVAYMKQPDVWPAYHGRGGSSELDILKLADVLACDGNANCTESFDLMLDLGANYGYYTEKLTLRKFAKNYIMIEANPNAAQGLKDTFGNQSWRHTWFTEQVRQKSDDLVPDFEIINQALSNHSDGVIDMCMTEPGMALAPSCSVPIASVDELMRRNLTAAFQEHLQQAQSAFIKIDAEGMDELVLRGMWDLLSEKRGKHDDASTRFLVNFLQFEYSPLLNKKARDRERFHEYDLKTVTRFLESIGFASFLIGPRFLPLSHGSWDDEFMTFTEDPRNNAGKRLTYPNFEGICGSWCAEIEEPSFTADVFAIRASHPRLQELKASLGACQESRDFDIKDPQYSFNPNDPVW